RATARWHLLQVPGATFHHSRPTQPKENLRRTRMWTVSANSFSYRWAGSRRRVLGQLARKRAGWLTTLARQRRWWRLAGASWGLLTWPAHLPRAEWRRRHPWGRPSMERWLVRTARLLE